DEVVRVGAWRVEGGARVEPERLVQAARSANVVDCAMGERLARAARASGGGAAASTALARALVGLHRPSEARQVLADAEKFDQDDRARARLALEQAHLLFWATGEETDAVEGLARAEA